MGSVIGRTFAQVKPLNVRKLFIPMASDEKQKIISIMVDYLLALNNEGKNNLAEAEYFEKVIDGVIYELFFPSQFKRSKIGIIEHLESIKSLTDEMSQSEMHSVITSEFQRLSKSNHPINQNLKELESINEIRIIRESLEAFN